MESNQTTERKTYHEQKYIDNTLRLREILKTLPAFAKDYFRAAEPTTSAKTRISYAYDIRVFFHFLMENNPVYKDYTIDQFTPQDLEQLSPVDIEEYQEYLKVYQNPEEKQITNTEKGLARKMSALRSFYGYYFKHQIIEKNPTLFVDMPKLHEKAIVRLDTDEVASLLDFVEHGGDELTGQKKVYYEKTKNRDLAIITLLLAINGEPLVPESVYQNVWDLISRMLILKITGLRSSEKVEMKWSSILARKSNMP